ncbi:MAG: hypothetical protein WCP77_18765 [Roseococcus sp.]
MRIVMNPDRWSPSAAAPGDAAHVEPLDGELIGALDAPMAALRILLA